MGESIKDEKKIEIKKDDKKEIKKIDGYRVQAVLIPVHLSYFKENPQKLYDFFRGNYNNFAAFCMDSYLNPAITGFGDNKGQMQLVDKKKFKYITEDPQISKGILCYINQDNNQIINFKKGIEAIQLKQAILSSSTVMRDGGAKTPAKEDHKTEDFYNYTDKDYKYGSDAYERVPTNNELKTWKVSSIKANYITPKGIAVGLIATDIIDKKFPDLLVSVVEGTSITLKEEANVNGFHFVPLVMGKINYLNVGIWESAIDRFIDSYLKKTVGSPKDIKPERVDSYALMQPLVKPIMSQLFVFLYNKLATLLKSIAATANEYLDSDKTIEFSSVLNTSIFFKILKWTIAFYGIRAPTAEKKKEKKKVNTKFSYISRKDTIENEVEKLSLKLQKDANKVEDRYAFESLSESNIKFSQRSPNKPQIQYHKAFYFLNLATAENTLVNAIQSMINYFYGTTLNFLETGTKDWTLDVLYTALKGTITKQGEKLPPVADLIRMCVGAERIKTGQMFTTQLISLIQSFLSSLKQNISANDLVSNIIYYSEKSDLLFRLKILASGTVKIEDYRSSKDVVYSAGYIYFDAI